MSFTLGIYPRISASSDIGRICNENTDCTVCLDGPDTYVDEMDEIGEKQLHRSYFGERASVQLLNKKNPLIDFSDTPLSESPPINCQIASLRLVPSQSTTTRARTVAVANSHLGPVKKQKELWKNMENKLERFHADLHIAVINTKTPPPNSVFQGWYKIQLPNTCILYKAAHDSVQITRLTSMEREDSCGFQFKLEPKRPLTARIKDAIRFFVRFFFAKIAAYLKIPAFLNPK